MSAYRKNLLVGLTVLLALLLLGWMILRFSDAPFQLFRTPQITLRIRAATAEGVSVGTPIYYLGVSVGRVDSIEREPDGRNVVIVGLVDANPPLPANLQAQIRNTQLIGAGATIHLILVDPAGSAASGPGSHPAHEPGAADIQPVGRLTHGQIIDSTSLSISEAFPEITKLSAELRMVVEEFRSAGVIARLATAVDSFNRAANEATELIASAKRYVNDEKLFRNVNDAVADFRETAAAAKRASEQLEGLMANADKLVTNTNAKVDELGEGGTKLLATANSKLEELSKSLTARLDQSAAVLANVEQLTRKANEGDGTAARLLNDPALYETLLDVSRELKATTKDLSRLIQQWEQEGISFKLRGGK